MCSRWGEPSSDSQGTRVAGALVSGHSPDTMQFHKPLLLTPGIDRTAAPHIFFAGRSPGQISSWPAEPLPDIWEPVWAIPMSRRGTAIYCAGSVDGALPVPAQEPPERQRLDLWKEILWRRRKRIAAPRQPALARLWKAYGEAARDA
jgi:hypothetical protein